MRYEISYYLSNLKHMNLIYIWSIYPKYSYRLLKQIVETKMSLLFRSNLIKDITLCHQFYTTQQNKQTFPIQWQKNTFDIWWCLWIFGVIIVNAYIFSSTRRKIQRSISHSLQPANGICLDLFQYTTSELQTDQEFSEWTL